MVKTERKWFVRINESGKKTRTKVFPLSENDDDAENVVRKAAELHALSHGARPHIRPPAKFAAGMKDVPPISWDGDARAFVVNGDDQTWTYAIADYEDDISAARTAAENQAIAVAREKEAELKKWTIVGPGL